MSKLQSTGGSATATQPARENSPQAHASSTTDQPGTAHSQKPVHVEAPVSESASPATSSQLKSQRNADPSEERIRLVAYQLWCDRGRPIGTPELDWLEAERLCQSSEE